MLILVSIATFCSTMLGGLFALRLRDHLHLVLGFSAGAVVGVSFFDLLPEALDLARASYTTATIISVVALGFFAYLLLDRFLFLHTHPEDGHDHRGETGAGTLSLHSFLDGLGIGLAFQVNAGVGVIVAVAVLTHDFSDGINTVNFILKHGGVRAKALTWLAIDALAPVLGIAATYFLHVPEQKLGLLLALFAGFFLYIGASDLVPESHHSHPTLLTTLMTLLGAGVLYGTIRLAGI